MKKIPKKIIFPLSEHFEKSVQKPPLLERFELGGYGLTSGDSIYEYSVGSGNTKLPVSG